MSLLNQSIQVPKCRNKKCKNNRYSSRKVLTGFIEAAEYTLYPTTAAEMPNITVTEIIKVATVVA